MRPGRMGSALAQAPKEICCSGSICSLQHSSIMVSHYSSHCVPRSSPLQGGDSGLGHLKLHLRAALGSQRVNTRPLLPQPRSQGRKLVLGIPQTPELGGGDDGEEVARTWAGQGMEMPLALPLPRAVRGAAGDAGLSGAEMLPCFPARWKLQASSRWKFLHVSMSSHHVPSTR